MKRLAIFAAIAVAVSGAAARDASADTLVVGDSLAVGTTPYLRQLVHGSVASDARVGRPSPETVGVLRSLYSGQDVVVFDAGTNDNPSAPSVLARDLASARALTGDTCMVIATINRPPYRGVGPEGLNQAVRSFASSARNVQLVEWQAAARANPSLLGSDHVHATGAGYQLRARLFAQAIQNCGSSGGGSVPTIGGLPPAGTPPPANIRPPAPPPPPKRHRKRPTPPPEPKPEPKPKPPPKLGNQSPVVLDEPVTWRSSGVKLSGELLSPGAQGRHPAVVMIQGSGPAVREPYREQAEYLAEHGVAALIYDKRGSGQSTGDPGYTYAQLAADARAAVDFLRGRPNVQPEGIGLWGFSEGAYVAPMVAATDPAVAAVMVVSPSVVAPASQQDWQVRNALDVGGASAGTAAVSRYYSVSADLSRDQRLQPTRWWGRVEQPVLAAWGSADSVVPVHDSAIALSGALSEGGKNEDRQFREFQGASHVLGVSSESGRPGSAAGFKELSAEWLRDHLEGRPPPRVDTPIPPARGPTAQPVEEVSFLEQWPVQLAWLLLPALAMAALGVMLWRGRGDTKVSWWWLGGAVALDLLALATLAFGVAAIVEVDGAGVEAVAGIPVVMLVAWVFTLAGLVVTSLVARRSLRGERAQRTPSLGLTLAGAAWLALALYWLV